MQTPDWLLELFGTIEDGDEGALRASLADPAVDRALPEPVLLAVEAKRPEILELLLAGGFSARAAAHGSSAMHGVCRDMAEGVALARVLAAHGGATDEHLDPHGYAALHYAAARGDAELVGILLDGGAIVDVRAHPSKVTPLHLAGSAAVVRRLAAAHAGLEALNQAGATPLLLVASGASLVPHPPRAEIIGALLEVGASPSAELAGRNVLVVAVRAGEWEVAERLLAVIDPNLPDEIGYRPLDLAMALPGSEAAVRFARAAVARGADLGAVDPTGRTAADLVSAWPSGPARDAALAWLSTLRTLNLHPGRGTPQIPRAAATVPGPRRHRLGQRAPRRQPGRAAPPAPPPTPRGRRGRGPRSAVDNLAVATVLLKAGADPQGEAHGRSPLSHAVGIGDAGLPLVKQLVEKGADPGRADAWCTRLLQ